MRQHILALPVLGPCVPFGVGVDMSILPGATTVVRVVGVPLPPTVIVVNFNGLSVQKGLSG